MAESAAAVDKTGPMSAAISVHGLRKRYGEFIAVDGVDLEVSTGEIL
ncbi:MAG: hypothetical protein RJA49_397, partial [Actinomycetota bacterium]